jgi:hypothetical protein
MRKDLQVEEAEVIVVKITLHWRLAQTFHMSLAHQVHPVADLVQTLHLMVHLELPLGKLEAQWLPVCPHLVVLALVAMWTVLVVMVEYQALVLRLVDMAVVAAMLEDQEAKELQDQSLQQEAQMLTVQQRKLMVCWQVVVEPGAPHQEALVVQVVVMAVAAEVAPLSGAHSGADGRRSALAVPDLKVVFCCGINQRKVTWEKIYY